MIPDLLLDAREQLYDRSSLSGSARYIAEHGLDPVQIEAHAGCLCLVKGEMMPGGRWDLRRDYDGDALVVIEAFGRDAASAVDLVAWPADGDPSRTSTMFGEAAVLGVAQVENPATYYSGKPLRVFRTPLRWLAAGCSGVAILDRDRAIDPLSEAPGSITGEDIHHGRELARLLRQYVDPTKVVAPLRRAA